MELAWASGLFEGEGCFASSTDDKGAIAVLSMTDEDAVQRFAGAVGVGAVHGPYAPSGTRTKLYWTWRINSFEGVQAVVAMLWSGLGVRRRARATEVLRAAHSERIANRRDRCHPERPYQGKGKCRTCYQRDRQRVRAAARRAS